MRTLRISFILLVFMMVLVGYNVNAQSTYTTYQLLSEYDDKALTVKDGTLSFETKKIGVSIYNQLFVIRRTENNQVMVIPASAPALRLMRDGSSIGLSSAGQEADYLWEVNFSGVPFLTLALPGAPVQVLTRQGGSLILANLPELSGNSDQSGALSRLKIVSVSNTF